MLMAPITYTFLANADTMWAKCMCGYMKPYWPELLVLGLMFLCKISSPTHQASVSHFGIVHYRLIAVQTASDVTPFTAPGAVCPVDSELRCSGQAYAATTSMPIGDFFS
jgi:hypothetical protein